MQEFPVQPLSTLSVRAGELASLTTTGEVQISVSPHE